MSGLSLDNADCALPLLQVAFKSCKIVAPEELGLYKNRRATRVHGNNDKLLVFSCMTTVAKTVPERNRILESTRSADSKQFFKSQLPGVSPPQCVALLPKPVPPIEGEVIKNQDKTRQTYSNS